MRYRRAVAADVSLLAGLNRQLIRDEGSRNPMGPDRLEARRRGWLEGKVWIGCGRLCLEVLVGNRAGLAFWCSAWGADYALTLEKELGS